ncbi:ubiquinol-cytochrome C reductase hinge protein-domain-containing protein [Sordaria brevicollis]|uniref:Ubiquinol-cytochrome C reductase hinge protein-domain-containing protein n=1 Tax=Sordaria brevicollis TaxID=83679 RepID=A0AAE0UEZ2_SORBR|nr:ubiquinol-cytochrome C reductase hinge protein-domain-containing protein [Sordaria brevicollis]
MGFWDAVTDLIDAATPWATVEAEAPADTPAELAPASESTEETTAETEAEEPAAAADEEEEAEEEEEEEDEDEIVDPKETLEEAFHLYANDSPTPTCYGAQLETEHDVLTGVLLTECRNSKECAPAKHHYDECVARVTGAGADNKEDCVEEFFHLAHCATQCAAPKLWNVLK